MIICQRPRRRGPSRGPLGLAALLVLAGAIAPALAQENRPAEVLSWRHRILPREEYVRLSSEWGAYVTGHPSDARAWVEWGDALRYSGESDSAREKYARAFAVDSTDAVAVAAYANDVMCYLEPGSAWKLAHQRLLRARKLDPDCPQLYYALWATALRAGDDRLAEDCLRRMVELGDMPLPLLDYGANMVKGAPPGAIIFTNGDNDTYPPLAYQAITGQRRDVSIVNVSLMNAPWFIRYLRDRGIPITWSDGVIDTLKPQGPDLLVADQLQQHIYRNLARAGWPRPLCYAITVAPQHKTIPCRRVLEGLIERVLPGTEKEVALAKLRSASAEGSKGKQGDDDDASCDWQRMREAVDTVYRFDSATDPTVDWTRDAVIVRLCRNYSVILMRLGEHLLDTGDAAGAGVYLFRAVAILAFHRDWEMAERVLDLWSSKDPRAPLLARAKALRGPSRPADATGRAGR